MKTNNFLDFLEKTQKLKHTLRHAWTEDITRQESTAEHSWHMSIMAIVLTPLLKSEVSLLQVLKLIAVHDLGEAITGDTPAFAPIHDQKYKAEKRAVQNIIKSLPAKSQREIISLYAEYEAKETPEAILVKMLDVLDVEFQHLIADISTWSEEELTFNLLLKSSEYFKNDPFMLKLYRKINNRLKEKVKRRRGQKIRTNL